MSMMSRQRDKLFLIGYMSHQITGSKLPSNCQVLRSLFYNMRQVKLNKREAARLTIKEVLVFWEKAKIPTREIKHCVLKLEELYDKLRKLQKNSSRSASATQNQKQEDFKLTFDDLFDVAHQDALAKTAEEDREFLLLQREKGRPGCMGGVDMKFVRKEKRKKLRQETEMARFEKSKKYIGEFVFFINFSLIIHTYINVIN